METRGTREPTGGRSGARALGNLLNGDGVVQGVGIQRKIDKMHEERGVLEVDLHKS